MNRSPGLEGRSVLTQLGTNTAAGPHYEADAEAAPLTSDPLVRLIAFYLPQYHPIPENDRWWGKGFTDWTNVSKAAPRFAGHYQPHLPGELGFYDLRLPDILRQQAALARRYGIGGFCFHYYWFGGKQLLETPLNLLLANPDIDLPFCVNWANDNWTRRWDGYDEDVLIGQKYSPEDDAAFAASLEPLVRDPRYIHIGGRPLLMLYRPILLPDAAATVRRWRSHFRGAGLPDPYVVMAQVDLDLDPRKYGMDAAAEFPPHKVGWDLPDIKGALEVFDGHFTGRVYSYPVMAERARSLPAPAFTLFRGVCPSWDNEARRPGRGSCFAGSTPAEYGRWLADACNKALEHQPDERVVFINAWNEWAEGAHLEPDRHHGYAYLAQTARVLNSLHQASGIARRLLRRQADAGAKPGMAPADAILTRLTAIVARFPFPESELAELKKRRWILTFAPRGTVGAEIGVFRGHFSGVVLQQMKPQKMYFIDPWTKLGERYVSATDADDAGNALTTAVARAEAQLRAALFPQTRSVFLEEYFPASLQQITERLDWIYIHARPEYSATMDELQAADCVLAERGVIMGDDWPQNPKRMENGVFSAVSAFARTHGYDVLAAGPARQWAIRRRPRGGVDTDSTSGGCSR